MRKPMTLADAKALALSRGATLTVGDKVFNSSKAVVTPRPATPQPAPPPVAPPAPPPPPVLPPQGLSRQEVDALLAERDRHWRAEIDRLILAMPAPAPQIAPPPPPEPVREWVFEVDYAFNGVIKGIKARAAKS